MASIVNRGRARIANTLSVHDRAAISSATPIRHLTIGTAAFQRVVEQDAALTQTLGPRFG